MKLIFRTITIICYFLPFAALPTCEYLESDKNITEISVKDSANKVAKLDQSLTKQNVSSDSNKVNETKPGTSQKLQSKEADDNSDNEASSTFIKYLVTSGQNLSGLGVVLISISLGGVGLAIGIPALISFLISMSLLVGFRRIKTQKRILSLLILSLALLIPILIEVISVGIKWGAIALISVILIQILLELRERKTSI